MKGFLFSILISPPLKLRKQILIYNVAHITLHADIMHLLYSTWQARIWVRSWTKLGLMAGLTHPILECAYVPLMIYHNNYGYGFKLKRTCWALFFYFSPFHFPMCIPRRPVINWFKLEQLRSDPKNEKN